MHSEYNSLSIICSQYECFIIKLTFATPFLLDEHFYNEQWDGLFGQNIFHTPHTDGPFHLNGANITN